jgi:hypothetical protein
MNNYSSIDRAGGYIALFLIGLIGWTCDRVNALQSSLVPDNRQRDWRRNGNDI